MSTLTKTVALTFATVTALSAPAFAASLADIEDFDVNAAKLDLTLDRDGDGEVSSDEIIEGNMDVFDIDGSGAIDAEERGLAEEHIAAS